MFIEDKWVDSRYAKSNVGKEIASIILEDKDFWCQCQHILIVGEPLVKVLRLVDSEEKQVCVICMKLWIRQTRP